MRYNSIKKKQCEKEHFKKRFLERFGVEVNRHDIRDLVTRIQTFDNVTVVEKQSCRITVFRMRVKEKTAIIVYDKQRQVPVTCWNPLDGDFRSCYSEV